jgi:hypothetical protein
VAAEAEAVSGFNLEELLREHKTGRRSGKHLTMREICKMLREENPEWRREYEGSWTVPDPLLDPPDPPDPFSDPVDPLENDRSELLEILLCPTCDLELRAEPCSPVHALLQDNPLQHRLLLHLVEEQVKQVRIDTTKLCNICTGNPPIATGDCPHIVDKFGQIWMSKVAWEKLLRDKLDAEMELGDMTEVHNNYVDAVALERGRAEDDKKRWAAEWASEKFGRMLEDADWDGQGPSLGFQATFEQMLTEDG